MTIRDFILLLILAFLSIVFYGYLFSFMFFQTDSAGYLNAIDLLSGREAGVDRLHRLIKPLSLIFPSFLTMIFSIKTATALYTQQILTFVISVFLFVKINKIIFPDDDKVVFQSALLLIGCQCFAIYSLSLMIDGIAWAFELFAIWFYLSASDKYSGIYKFKSYLLGLILGLGFFVKETIFVSGLFIFIHVVMSSDSYTYKIKYLFQTGFVFILVTISGSLLSIALFQKSMLNWWEFAREDNSLFVLNFKTYLLQIYRSLDVFWIIALYGIFIFFRKQSVKLNSILFSLLLTALIALIIFPFVWYYRCDRIIFMMSMLLLPFVNIVNFNKSFQIPLVIIGAVFNILMTFRIYKFEENGWILFLSLIFLLLFLFQQFRGLLPLLQKK